LPLYITIIIVIVNK